MRLPFSALLAVLLLAGTPLAANLPGIGREQKVYDIQDTGLVDPDGQPLTLAHVTTGWYVGLGFWLVDDGYVLRIKGQDRWYPIPMADLRRYSEAGKLPKPLPRYGIPPLALLHGFSGWLVVGAGAVGALLWLSRRRPARRRAASGQEPPPPGDAPAAG